MRMRILQVVAAALAMASVSSHAVDGIAVEVGRGDGADMARIGAQWDWSKRWLQSPDWHVGGYWDLAIGQWQRNSAPGQNEDITEIGLTPVLRFQRNDLKGAYAEGGVGFHLLSHTSLGDHGFSTAFQFGNHLGVGYRFGAKSAYDVSYRFQHLSNAGIKSPNRGINFSQIRLQYHF